MTTTTEMAGSAAVLAAGPARATPERWLPVVGWEGWYSVSSHGHVRSEDRVIQRRNGTMAFARGQLLKPFPYSGTEGRRYLCVELSRDGATGTRRPVHLLVLEAFVGPRPPGTLGCHWDDDRANNTLANLRWDSPLANARDRQRNARQRAMAVISTWNELPKGTVT